MSKAEMTEIQIRIKKCTASVLGIEEYEINDDSSMDNMEMWDSIRHINLIIALEQEFGISFPDEEVALLTSVKLLYMSVKELIEEKS